MTNIAKKLEEHRWKVKADLPSYEKPSKIGKKRVYARHRNHKKRRNGRLIEIEDPISLRKDKDQLSMFRRHVAQKRGPSLK